MKIFSEESFEKTKIRFKAWWEREIIDRVLVQVWAPRKGRSQIWNKYGNVYGVFTSYEIMKEWQNKNFDHDYLIKEIENILSSIYYGGDAFPIFLVNLGPGSISAYFGCNIDIRKDTVWFNPLKNNDWENLTNIIFDTNNKYWQITKDLTKAVSDKSHGNYFVTAPDLGMSLDIAASIRGVEKLLFDLIDLPKEVKKLNDLTTKAFSFCYGELYNIIKNRQKEFLGWIPVYSDGKNYPIQCDFSTMISPEMFLEFFTPGLSELTSDLDKVIYHLDGPDTIKHLDILLDNSRIDAIQWVPGDGSPAAVHWIPMLKKIQKKGKALLVYAHNYDEVEKLMLELEPEGLLISTIANSEDEANSIVRKVQKLTK